MDLRMMENDNGNGRDAREVVAWFRTCQSVLWNAFSRGHVRLPCLYPSSENGVPWNGSENDGPL